LVPDGPKISLQNPAVPVNANLLTDKIKNMPRLGAKPNYDKGITCFSKAD